LFQQGVALAGLVRYEQQGRAARITLDSPHNLNAFGSLLLTEARTHLDRALDDPAVRAIVFGAEGRLFSSGSDLKEGPGSEPPLIALLDAVRTSPKPVIGEVGAPAYGGSLALLAVCDIVMAADTATFALPEVRFGIAPTLAAVYCVPRMNPLDALDMILTGEPFTAERARQAGLVTRVVPGAELQAATARLVDSLSLGGPNALHQAKQLCARIPTMTREEAVAFASRMTEEIMGSPEAKEGIASFAEKRTPGWQA
jgi:enoyl-CoA hydratase/carnithine racemase